MVCVCDGPLTQHTLWSVAKKTSHPSSPASLEHDNRPLYGQNCGCRPTFHEMCECSGLMAVHIGIWMEAV
jgi:hypothetical protein